MERKNPFTLSFGKSPNEIISRYDYANEIISNFVSDNPVSHAYLIEGVRGCGKTVLMTSIEKELAKENVKTVQFHPSYDYTDFVEGMRPNNQGTFTRTDGVFKRFCKCAILIKFLLCCNYFACNININF